MSAYYNEHDPFAAAWLRELIEAGHIAPGDVDERSIADVAPTELRRYTQCHFFAGIGVWSYALRQAGWPDDQPVWTGSCPCQPFSVAGQRSGFDDERHLWPFWHWHIRERGPAIILGEQVASKAADEWIDLVQDDLEGLGYAFAAVAFPSASVGAPHIRDRTFWLADAGGARSQGRGVGGHGAGQRAVGAGGVAGGLELVQGHGWIERGTEPSGRSATSGRGESGPVDASSFGRHTSGDGDHRRDDRSAADANGVAGRPGSVNGFWRDADWLFCRDGKWRPVEPGTFPLANGAPARVGRLRGYGNAINAVAAQAFIEAVMETAAC